MPKQIAVMVVAVAALGIAGCRDGENKRLAEQAERNLERQSQQELRNAELHRQVAEGTKRLVEADAAARKEIFGLHRDVQDQGFQIGRQRDALEADRREIASARNRDPIIAEAIKAVGLIAACLVLLLIALQILRRSDEPDENAAVAEILLSDLSSETPRLIQICDPSTANTGLKIPRLPRPDAKRIEHL